ncbi:MAG: HEPN domain-containing protein [Clostridia bacterium]|nr:HEPN domain-containing protein [Clostridia bacterium]
MPNDEIQALKDRFIEQLSPLKVYLFGSYAYGTPGADSDYDFYIPGGIPRTHDLSLLLDQMRNAVCISDDYYDLADQLTPYGTAARYPSNIQFSEYSAKKAIEAAEAILGWVQTQIAE